MLDAMHRQRIYLSDEVFIINVDNYIGKSTKKTYRIGDKLKVRVVSASKETAQIDFEIVSDKYDRNKK